MRTYSTIGSHLGVGFVSQSRHKRHSSALEQNDIHDLTEQEPCVVLEGQILVFLRNGSRDRTGWAISRRKSNLCPSSRQVAFLSIPVPKVAFLGRAILDVEPHERSTSVCSAWSRPSPTQHRRQPSRRRSSRRRIVSILFPVNKGIAEFGDRATRD